MLAPEVSIARSIKLNIEERSESTLLKDCTIAADDFSDKSHFLIEKNSIALACEVVAGTASGAIASARALSDSCLERHAAVRNAGVIRARLDTD